MVNMLKNIICLDGSDWYSNWFATNDEVISNKSTRHIRNQEMDSGESAKVFLPEYSTDGWMQGTIPGCARSFLIENKEIEDPYFARNCEKSVWVEEKSWWFRKEFKVPATWIKRKFLLKFLGLDYACDIYLNGELVASHLGMFVQLELDVSDIIQTGKENVLTIGFLPAPKAEPHHSHHEKVTEFAQYHRCQMSWGWDWSRHLVPTGIWDSVYLESYENIRIAGLWCRPENEELKVELDIDCIEAGDYSFYLDVSPENFIGKSYNQNLRKQLQPGRQKLICCIETDNPELWYPNGIGPQNLYKLSVQTDSSLKEQIFGFRQIEMLKNPESPEGAYPLTFCVNGESIFVRGGNWVPADMMPSRLSYADYERQIRLAAEAGMNMLRVWGGGLIEKDAFYECCNRYGILVWQEFPHSCSTYPQDREYLKFKEHEGTGIIKRLRNHPCIALWCGGNEMQYYGEQPDSPLIEQYKKLVNTNCPNLAFHVTSPDLSRPGERPHGPWKFMDHDFYNEHCRLFASEIGCNGMSEVDSIKKFIPDGESWPNGSAFKYHFLITHGQASITKALKEFDINTLEEFCQASQMAQADALGYIVEHYRSLWPKASGCLIWQYNESWPTLAYSLIDWHSYPKSAYYRLKKVCAPVILHLKDDSWNIKNGVFKAELWGINNSHSPLKEIEVQFTLMNSAGEIIIQDHFDTEIPANKPIKIRDYNTPLDITEKEDIIFGAIRMYQAGKVIFSLERIYGYNGFRKLFKIPQATIQAKEVWKTKKAGEYQIMFEVKNCTNVVAGGIHLSFPDIPVKEVFWEDNYFSLLPGEKRNISVRTVSELKPASLKLRALNSIEVNVPLTEQVEVAASC